MDEEIPLEQIVEYIKQKYHPLSIILYGSYADGTNDPNSDFDALVISREHEPCHDTSFVNGVQLDVFVYPASYFDGDFDCQDFIQIFDGKIIMDCDGRGETLRSQVLAYLKNRPLKSASEIKSAVDWCIKMGSRVKRGDAEGLFRWHWVLIDSLEIFCDIMEYPYMGPKKTLQWMENHHADAFACYQKALADFSIDALEHWITCIRTAHEAVR